MKKESEKLYKEWISSRQTIQAPEGFTEHVMREIAEQKDVNRMPRSDPYWVLASRPVQWAAAIGAVLLGLLRLSYITSALLIP